MNIHLRILLGPDRRYDLINKAVKISQNYFNTIGVLVSGPELYYNEIKEILPNNVLIRFHPDFFDIECARRHLISDVPENDWVLWLDGDEIPSQSLLDNIQNIIDDCEKNNHNVVILPWYLHMDGTAETDYKHYFEKLAAVDNDEWNSKPEKRYFSPKRLIKNIKNKSIRSNWGAHEFYFLENENIKYFGHVVNHFKTHHDWAQSPVYHMFMNPLVHNAITAEQIADILDCEIFKKLEQFKIKYNTFTSSEFIYRILLEDKMFIEDFIKIFDEINDHESIHNNTRNKEYKRMYYMVKTFIDQYHFKWILNPSYNTCGKICCFYKNFGQL